ncbi:MAG: hypothetical protein AB7L90_12100 [Hyphomicrobiaceae bacterium]
MPNKGFLLVTMQPPPAFEEEFNAWYDSEHIPERLAVPGILTARRYLCADGHPKYLAMYDLESHAVMQSPGYVRVGYENASPWTKRVTSRVNPRRSTGDQIWPGNKLTLGGSAVLLARFRAVPLASAPDAVGAARKVFEARPETLQLRVLAHDTGGAATDIMAFVEQRVPVSTGIDMAPFGRLADHIDLFNGYRPY